MRVLMGCPKVLAKPVRLLKVGNAAEFVPPEVVLAVLLELIVVPGGCKPKVRPGVSMELQSTPSWLWGLLSVA
jgi:hypothetical protein